jgi:hypothetical protein
MTGTTPRAPGSAVDIANLAVIIDPTSTKQPALAKALALAIRFHAAVTLLSFDTKQLKQTLLTDTDWHLLRFCPKPLLLSKSRQWQDSPIVVAAVDPLHGSDPNAALDHEIMAYAIKSPPAGTTAMPT